MTRIITTKELVTNILSAIGEDGRKTRRIVIDIPLDGAVLIYVEKYGDDKMLKIEFPTPDGINIKKVSVQNEDIK